MGTRSARGQWSPADDFGGEGGFLVPAGFGAKEEPYKGQMIYVVDIEQYLYLVPFVTRPDGTRFLKTIIPSRKATRDYKKRRSS